MESKENSIDVSIGVFELNDKSIPDLVRLPFGTPFPVELPKGAKVHDLHLGFDTLPDPKDLRNRVVVGQSARMLYSYLTVYAKDKENRFFVLIPSTKKMQISNESIMNYIGSFLIPKSVDYMLLFEVLNY